MRRRKSDKKKKMIISFFLVIFMISSVGSVILYYGSSGQDNTEFDLELSNGEYTFKRNIDQQGYQFYEVSKDNIMFTVYNLPSDLSHLNIDKEAQSALIQSPQAIITFDPEDELIQLIEYIRFDLGQNLPMTKNIVDATSEESDDYSLPVIDCGNETQAPVIFLHGANYTNISMQDNCIDVHFEQQNTILIRDYLHYVLRGIEVV